MEAIRPYEPLLQKSALFAGLSPADTEEALRRMHAQIREYPRGSFLHHAGQPMEQFGLVLCGGVNVCKDDLEGNRMLMANVGPGGTFAESLCYLRVREIPVYMLSTGDTCVLWLSPHSLFEAEGDALSARLRNRFTAMLAERALAMNTRIQILSKLQAADILKGEDHDLFFLACVRGGERLFPCAVQPRGHGGLYRGEPKRSLQGTVADETGRDHRF